MDSPVGAHHLSCSVAYGILLPQPRIEPVSPAPQGEFFIFGGLGLAARAFLQFGGGGYPSRGALASHCCGFSCRRAQAVQHVGFSSYGS